MGLFNDTDNFDPRALIATAGLMVMFLSWWGLVTLDHRRYDALVDGVQGHLSSVIAEKAHVTRGQGAAPDVEWQGRAVHVQQEWQPAGGASPFRSKAPASWKVFAVTASGRFYGLRVTLPRDCEYGPKAELLACLQYSDFSPYSREEAKMFVFREMKDPKVFLDLFSEEMPVAVVKA